MEIIEFGPLTDAIRRELEGDEQDPFDATGITLHFQPKDRHVGLRDDSGRLVASTGIVLAEVEVDLERFSVVGLGGVIVNARHRGRGLGRQVVQAALTNAEKLGPAFALLFCHEDRAGLYRKLGFAPVEAEVVVWQSAGYVSMPQQTMWRPLHEKRDWPRGRVCGGPQPPLLRSTTCDHGVVEHGRVRSRKPTKSRALRPSGRVRGASWVLVIAGIVVETLATWLRSGRLGGHLVVRCRAGHLFTTIWIHAASIKSLRLGFWRFQRCPVGHHWTVVSPVKEASLTGAERRAAAERRDTRLP